MRVVGGENDSARTSPPQPRLFPALCAALLLFLPQAHLQISPTPPPRPAAQNDEVTASRLKAEIVRLHNMRAEVFRKERQWEKVRTELENAWKLDPQSPALQADLADARFHAADYNGAIELLEPLVGTRPHNINLRRLLGRADFCAGKPEAVRSELKGLAMPGQPCEPRQNSPHAALEAEDLSKLAASQKALVEEYTRLAENQARRGEFNQAVHSLEVVESLAPVSGKLESSLGAVLYHAERYPEAVERLKHALKANPADANAKEYLGLAYSESGEYAKAVPLLEEVRQSRPDDEQVLLGLAYALALSGRPDDAQRLIEDLLKTHPDSAPLHILWGRAYASQDQLDEARQEFQRALELDPQIPEAHFYLGVLAFQLANLEEAGREFQAELASHPNDVRSRYHLAVTLLRERRSKEGIVLLRQVIEARPDHAAAHYALGKALLEQGELEPARRELETSVKLDPDAAYSHYQLGRAYTLAGRKQDAEREFRLTEELKKKARRAFPPPLQQ